MRTLALRAGLASGQPTFGAGFRTRVRDVDVQIDVASQEAPNIGGWESVFGFTLFF
jgi:hypothetical protein